MEMKKLSLMLAASALSAAAFAGPTKALLFSSTGPDKYADGAVVEDGEVYAIVYTASGAEFAGIDAKGNLVDPTNSKIIGKAYAENGRCAPTLVIITGGNEDLDYENGAVSVYLLDTRVTDEAGKVAVAKKDADGTYVSCSGYETLASGVKVQSTVALDEDAAAGDGAVATALPADVPQPSVDAITVKDGKVYVKVSNTVPYVRYAISAGVTPAANDVNLANGVNGVDGGAITLVVDNPEANRFFKVVRSK